jgi:hypothetical protein
MVVRISNFKIMKKFSLIFAFILLGTVSTGIGQGCNVTPVSGRTYVAGFCSELINQCVELPSPPPGELGLPGDCFVEKDGPTPLSRG